MRSVLVLSGFALLSLAAAALGGDAGLRDQLSALARQHGFVIEGLDRVQGPASPPVDGPAREVLMKWLETYNYLVVGGKAGTLERVVITGVKPERSKSSASPSVRTTREGIHHRVSALLTGPNGVPREVSLIVDTGASSIVLPDSLAPELGFTEDNLQIGSSQTANGVVAVRTGVLSRVHVGQTSSPDVQVVFVPDRRLGRVMLLGMSFLNRFRFTLDDDKDELILLAK